MPSDISQRTPVTGPAVWRSADLNGKSDVLVKLGSEEIEAVERALAATSKAGIALTELEREHFADPIIERFMQPIVSEVSHGRGLVVLGGLPVERYDEATITRFFWGLGRYFGTPVSQSVLGDRVGHVVNHADHDPNARGYRHHYELTPHTDYQDIVAFLCLQPGHVGGMSWFVSALAVHNELLSTSPDLLEILYRGFYCHRFGEQGPDEASITEYRLPVFSNRDGVVSCRYLRRYIELAAHETVALTAIEDEALETLDSLSMRRDLGLGFMLERGEVAIMNNYVVLHGRAGFEDSGGKAWKRHLVRLWLHAPDFRPLVPEIALYASERAGQGVLPKDGHIPSYDDHETVDRIYGRSRMPTV